MSTVLVSRIPSYFLEVTSEAHKDFMEEYRMASFNGSTISMLLVFCSDFLPQQEYF